MPKTKPIYKAFWKSADGSVKVLQVRYGGGSRVLVSVGKESIWLDRAQLADLAMTLNAIYRSVLKADIKSLEASELKYIGKAEEERVERVERVDVSGDGE